MKTFGVTGGMFSFQGHPIQVVAQQEDNPAIKHQPLQC